MSKQAETWRVPSAAIPPESFWTDFGKFVLASKQCDDTDHYWKTLIDWANHLMDRYAGNEVVCHIVVDYIDGQSRRSLNGKPREIE